MNSRIGFKKAVVLVLIVMAAGAANRNARGAERGRGEGGRVIDRVIAVVEDKALLQSEFEIEYKRLLLQIGDTENITIAKRKEIREEVLDGLVADLLMAVHAERVGIEITQESIDDQVQEGIERNRKEIGGEEAFNEELKKNGITIQQLRRQWHEKLQARQLIQKLMYKEVMGQVDITEKELKEYYRKNIAELPLRPATVTLAQIVILPIASGKSKEKALGKIRMIEEKIQEGEDFADLAKKYSEGPSAKYGGNLGFVKLEDLNNPEFEKAASKLKVGEISPPVLTDFGYHLIKLDEIDGENMHMRHILVKLKEGTDEIEEAYNKAKQIRKRILDGEDFGKLASQYSADEKSGSNKGLVGEIAIRDLPEFFRNAIKDVEPGGVAPVVKDSKGFRIIKLLGSTQQRVYSFKEAQEDLKKLLRQERLQKNYADYVETLKGKYYVDIKEDVVQ
ncbi:peptidylprolyl isomerase [bacterium]|nr:peptidylprolyl isomerase [bacterium]